MGRNEVRRIEKRMRAVLRVIEADYDFSTFTMEGFKEWLEQCTGRPIRFIPQELQSASGGWVADINGCDFVFYDVNTSPLHQTHIQLHEMSHIVCNHPRIEFDDIMKDGSVVCESVLLRGAHSEMIDLEAEVLASLIQQRIIHYGRLAELTRVTSHGFTENLAKYIEQFGKE